MNLSGSPFDFVIAFFGGVLASFTPCVYPLIPVSAGYLIGNAGKTKGLFLGLSYVTGIAVTYSFLGILAVLTGTLFGNFSSDPVVILTAGIIIVVFGLSMFGLFHFNFNLIQRFPLKVRGNYFFAFLFGLVSGLMVSPCLTPILGSILAYLSVKGNIFYGAFLLFCFSYGMGAIFILIAVFGSKLNRLPKPGRWMVISQKIFASVIILSGVYFIFTAIRSF
ncbi:MAG: cytochrome c biogenesis protein CcdA [Candidatus Omnitrophota bacterium]